MNEPSLLSPASGGGKHPRDEVEAAFKELYQIAANDQVDVWARRFTDDAIYEEHMWGTFHGADEIEHWVIAVAHGALEVYPVLDWYVVDGNRVVFQVQNRRDSPVEGDPPIDFVSWQILEYAGDGLWSYGRDIYWWAEARAATKRYHELRRTHDPDHPQRRTRLHLSTGEAWTRPTPGVELSWLDRTDIAAVIRPSELTVGTRSAFPPG